MIVQGSGCGFFYVRGVGGPAFTGIQNVECSLKPASPMVNYFEKKMSHTLSLLFVWNDF